KRDLFNNREISHMKDVKQLVRGVYVLALVSAAYLAAMIVVGFSWQKVRFVPALAKRLTWGGGLTLILMVVFGIAALVGFDGVFLKFHQLSFANDLWQLNPRTDYLVRIFPQNFWFDATMWVSLRVIAGALILTVVGSGYFVYGRYTGWQRTLNGAEST
ncbi:MAG: TIGR01906 family membrane protein, partial [Chloroflexota bacterium]|nr:TIGR01906 family membrane protein [Chloroflexota bacterium]